MKSKLTPELTADVDKYISMGMTNQDVCNLVGIEESTFYKWLQTAEEPGADEKYVKFSDTVKKALSNFKAQHVLNILKASKLPQHWQASAWMLERKFPKEFGKIDRLAVEREDDNGMIAEILAMVKKDKGGEDE